MPTSNLPSKNHIGQVYEICTVSAYGYFQVTHYVAGPPTMGHLIRIVGRFTEPQVDPMAIAARDTMFQIFFPLKDALKRGLVRLVGPAPIPAQDSAFPIFRSGVRDLISKEIKNWWLWDGKTQKNVGMLKENQFRFPHRAVYNAQLLSERIEAGWKNEDYR